MVEGGEGVLGGSGGVRGVFGGVIGGSWRWVGGGVWGWDGNSDCGGDGGVVGSIANSVVGGGEGSGIGSAKGGSGATALATGGVAGFGIVSATGCVGASVIVSVKGGVASRPLDGWCNGASVEWTIDCRSGNAVLASLIPVMSNSGCSWEVSSEAADEAVDNVDCVVWND